MVLEDDGRGWEYTASVFSSPFGRKITYACDDEDVRFWDDPVETCCNLPIFAGEATAA